MGKVLTDKEVSNLATFIRRCEIEKAVQQSMERQLDVCEFEPDRYWTPQEAFWGVAGSFVVGIIVGASLWR